MVQHIFFMLGWWRSWWRYVVCRKSTIDQNVFSIAGLDEIAPIGHRQRLSCGERDGCGTQLHEIESLWRCVAHWYSRILSFRPDCSMFGLAYRPNIHRSILASWVRPAKHTGKSITKNRPKRVILLRTQLKSLGRVLSPQQFQQRTCLLHQQARGKNQRGTTSATPGILADGAAGSPRMSGTVDYAASRYWNGWSPLPPPPPMQLLFIWLERGQAISLYSSA
jgi:hypothetical protein